jgi:hypothetical protein
MALDRQTHDTIAEYTFPRLVGIAMACADDNTMSFLTRNDEGNKLLLVTVAAKRASKVTDPQ